MTTGDEIKAGFAKIAAKHLKKGNEYVLGDISHILTIQGEEYLGKTNLIAIGQELIDMGYNINLDEALTKFNKGSLIKHELHPEFNGTVEIGPDTYDNIKNAGYEMPDSSDYEQSINEPIWYGIILTQNQRKVGVNFNDFILD